MTVFSCGTSLQSGAAVGKKGVSEEEKRRPFPLPSPQDPLRGLVLGYCCTGYYSVQGVTSSTLTVLNVTLLCFRCARDLLDFFVSHSQTRVLTESRCLSLINHAVFNN